MSSSVHGASAELIGEVSRRDGGVREYSINPLVTLCHSPYVLRKQGETISPAGVLEYVVIDFDAMGLPWCGQSMYGGSLAVRFASHTYH